MDSAHQPGPFATPPGRHITPRRAWMSRGDGRCGESHKDSIFLKGSCQVLRWTEITASDQFEFPQASGITLQLAQTGRHTQVLHTHACTHHTSACKNMRAIHMGAHICAKHVLHKHTKYATCVCTPRVQNAHAPHARMHTPNAAQYPRAHTAVHTSTPACAPRVCRHAHTPRHMCVHGHTHTPPQHLPLGKSDDLHFLHASE